jgi:hypothetical protein
MIEATYRETLVSHYSDVRKRLEGRPALRRTKVSPPHPDERHDVACRARSKHSDEPFVIGQADVARRFPAAYRILVQVSQRHTLTVEELRAKSRKPALVLARGEACYRIRQEVIVGGLPPSFWLIGGMVGGLCHTTVINCIAKYLKDRTL